MTNRNEPHTVGKIEAEGIVRAVEIDDDGGGTFKLLLDNGDTLTAPFSSKQDMMVTNALRMRHKLRLSIAGPAEFDAAGNPRRILHLDRCEPTTKWAQDFQKRVAAKMKAAEAKTNTTDLDDSAPFWKKIAARGESIPDEVLDRIPTDLAKNWHDYKYGRKGKARKAKE